VLIIWFLCTCHRFVLAIGCIDLTDLPHPQTLCAVLRTVAILCMQLLSASTHPDYCPVPPNAQVPQNEHPRCSFCEPHSHAVVSFVSLSSARCHLTGPSRRLPAPSPPIPPLAWDTQNERPACLFCVSRACTLFLTHNLHQRTRSKKTSLQK
jgi:hypothetical protein